MSENAPRIVIRKKRVVHDDAHSSGSWKIAYADFMTAMMALFLVMWILSLVPENELKDLADYFRRPLISAVTGDPYTPASRNVIPGGGTPSPIPGKGNLQDIATLIPQVGRAEQSEDHDRLENLKRNIDLQIESNPTLKNFQPQMVMDMTPEGLRIQILDNQQQPMFATGSARLHPEMVYILKELAPLLNNMPNGVSISGHTDATQYVTGEHAYSNWELSADRANSARQALINSGMAENKVRRILGLSSTVNLVKDDPYSPLNRRISIVVLNHKTEQLMDKMNATPGLSQDDLNERLKQAREKQQKTPSPSLAGVQNSLSSIHSVMVGVEPYIESDHALAPVSEMVAGSVAENQAQSKASVQLVQGIGKNELDFEQLFPSRVNWQEHFLLKTADTVVGSLLGTATASVVATALPDQVSTNSLVTQEKPFNSLEKIKEIENPAVNTNRASKNSLPTDLTDKEPLPVQEKSIVAQPVESAVKQLEPVQAKMPSKPVAPVKKAASAKEPSPKKKAASRNKESPAKKVTSGKKPVSTNKAASSKSTASTTKAVVARQGKPPLKENPGGKASPVIKSSSQGTSGSAKSGPLTKAINTEIDLKSILHNNFYQ